MTPTTVAVLTPPGSAAVAALSVRGPDAWPVLGRLFRTAAGRALVSAPTNFVFGRLGGQTADEVIVATAGPDAFEVHCHGGPQVVAWVLGLLAASGVRPAADERPVTWAGLAADMLPRARTVRTAGLLLDQSQGAYDRAEHAIRAGAPGADELRQTLLRNARAGRHLVEPWTVALAGAPNAGKSSLLNALAGFARSVVSPVPGTTRDAVSVPVAFDGWPVDLIDTAGLRQSADELEVEGVGRARTAAATADLVLWVADVTGPPPAPAPEVAAGLGVPPERVLLVLNKIDLAAGRPDEPAEGIPVSAVTGAGLPDLVGRIVRTLVPDPPAPGDPVPFTPEQCDRWS